MHWYAVRIPPLKGAKKGEGWPSEAKPGGMHATIPTRRARKSGVADFGFESGRSRVNPRSAAPAPPPHKGPQGTGQSHMSKPYPKSRPRSGTTLVVLDRGGFQTRP